MHPDSRRYLVVRHPGTGKLMWAPRLPFGYVESPRLFCSLMEAIADVLRIEEASIRVVDRSETHVHLLEYRSGGGQLIHFFVFVDDWLVVGDTEELTVEGCSLFERALLRLGISWAPNKHRGPSRVMEFLGLLLSRTWTEFLSSPSLGGGGTPCWASSVGGRSGQQGRGASAVLRDLCRASLPPCSASSFSAPRRW